MPRQMNLKCPNCGRPFTGTVDTVIDPTLDPQAKARLLCGQLNTLRCPNCGNPVTVAAPVLYHDASKELLIAFMPMELNLTKDQQEKAIGDLMRELKLTQQAMKGYVFQPRRALTMQNLIEQVLQADGVTPEMMEEQRNRVRLLENLMQTPPDNAAGVRQAARRGNRRAVLPDDHDDGAALRQRRSHRCRGAADSASAGDRLALNVWAGVDRAQPGGGRNRRRSRAGTRSARRRRHPRGFSEYGAALRGRRSALAGAGRAGAPGLRLLPSFRN